VNNDQLFIGLKMKLRKLAVVIPVLLAGNLGLATELTENLTLSTFGTVGMVHSDSDEADFVTSSGLSALVG
jgi:hypothetical protein